ncbi:hypothetical protein [Methanosarcina sp.]|uniref:hypothetical protein n=1 Tax=Methanosarcina sp. TaxID=2213 RepID=UPI0029890315|nr:hypothetical protein [Methanosarcina sp.]MDW5550422.1 hypothetical protein [Methanosarcina sp.]MDW5554746.1 hypothetical protein [Methanosarcina sp.]MDW5559955.1 hypothetical protein [Methanosarcina sp.]
MYIKTFCAHCGKTNLHNVAVSCEKTSSILNGKLFSRSTIKGVEVRETVTEEILMKSVLKTLREHKKLHMSKEELADTLKNIFGISSELSCEIAEKIQRENEVLEADFKSNIKAIKKTSKSQTSKKVT